VSICACSAVTGQRTAYKRITSQQFVLKHLSQNVLPDHSGRERSTTQTSARGGSADLVDAPEAASSRPVKTDEEKDAVAENAGHQDRKVLLHAPVSVPQPALASLPSNAAARSGERVVHTELPSPRKDATVRASVSTEDLVNAPEAASSRPVKTDEEKDAVAENAGHQDRKVSLYAPVSVPQPALASLPTNAAARSGERAVHTELPMILNAMENTPPPREVAEFSASVIAEGSSASPISRRMNSEDGVQSGRTKQSPLLVPCASRQEGVWGVPQQQLQLKEIIQQQPSPNQQSGGEPASGQLPCVHLGPDDTMSERVKHLAPRFSEKRSPQVLRTDAHTQATCTYACFHGNCLHH
jgi:hypothetical protein